MILHVIFEEEEVFTDEMSAYRPMRSGQDNILDLTTDAEQAKSEGNHVAAVFFDISGAYNKLKHSVIEDLMVDVGIDPHCGFFKLIMSNLKGRKITMKCDDTVTDEFEIADIGVSQGAVLSPLIFAACTKRIRQHLPADFALSQFSDDGVLWTKCRGKKPNPLKMSHLRMVMERIQRELGEM